MPKRYNHSSSPTGFPTYLIHLSQYSNPWNHSYCLSHYHRHLRHQSSHEHPAARGNFSVTDNACLMRPRFPQTVIHACSITAVSLPTNLSPTVDPITTVPFSAVVSTYMTPRVHSSHPLCHWWPTHQHRQSAPSSHGVTANRSPTVHLQ